MGLNIMVVIIILNMNLFFNCFCRVGLKYYGCNLFNLYIFNFNFNRRVEKWRKILGCDIYFYIRILYWLMLVMMGVDKCLFNIDVYM